MREILTDELIENMANEYQYFKNFMEESGAEKIFTFDQFLQKHLRMRAWKLRKDGIHVEV